MYIKNINLFVLMMLVLVFSAYKVNAQSNANPTPTNFIPRQMVYPTPNWDHMKSGYDYVPNNVLVTLKKGISAEEEKRVVQRMSIVGNVIHHKFKCLTMNLYEIKITNGMSEKKVIEMLNVDPAVESADVNGIRHIGPRYPGGPQ